MADVAGGTTQVAFVLPRADACGDHNEAARHAWAGARLGKSQRLAKLVFVDQLPRSKVGKVFKRQSRHGFDRTVP